MIKEEVLAILKKKNDYVSGETLSTRLGVSRMDIIYLLLQIKAIGSWKTKIWTNLQQESL